MTHHLRVIALLSLASPACLGNEAPLAVGDDVAPVSCPAVDAAPGVVDATAVHTSTGLWMSDGFVRDMRAAGFGGKYGSHFAVADALSGFVSYGMDVVTLNQSGTLAADFGWDWNGPPSSLIVGGFQSSAGSAVVPRTGYWLAGLVWDGMTNAVQTTKGDLTIRESPGGRVHCELSNKGLKLECAFRGVVHADLH